MFVLLRRSRAASRHAPLALKRLTYTDLIPLLKARAAAREHRPRARGCVSERARHGEFLTVRSPSRGGARLRLGAKALRRA